MPSARSTTTHSEDNLQPAEVDDVARASIQVLISLCPLRLQDNSHITGLEDHSAAHRPVSSGASHHRRRTCELPSSDFCCCGHTTDQGALLAVRAYTAERQGDRHPEPMVAGGLEYCQAGGPPVLCATRSHHCTRSQPREEAELQHGTSGLSGRAGVSRACLQELRRPA